MEAWHDQPFATATEAQLPKMNKKCYSFFISNHTKKIRHICFKIKNLPIAVHCCTDVGGLIPLVVVVDAVVVVPPVVVVVAPEVV